MDYLERLRGFLLFVFLLGVVGLAAELAFLEHYDDAWQWTPFALYVLSLAVLLWYGIAKSRTALRAFRGVMVLFLIAGPLGIYLHLTGNVEFEKEMDPDIGGWALLWEAIRGATPALAPGAMVQLGLVGLAYTIGHSALRRTGQVGTSVES